jgi:hypothetical protein
VTARGRLEIAPKSAGCIARPIAGNGPDRQESRTKLEELVDPPHTTILCMEIERGVVGDRA